MSETAALAELAKRRGFFFASNEAYGGTAGFYTYGPKAPHSSGISRTSGAIASFVNSATSNSKRRR